MLWTKYHGVSFSYWEVDSALQRLLRLLLHCLLHNANLLIDFSLTEKVATLIFISVCGLAIPSANEGKSSFIYNLVTEFKSSLKRANVCVFHENRDRVFTELTFINP